MKGLLAALLVCGMAVSGADKARSRKAPAKAGVEQCFKVHRLLKTDEAHYWADWTNNCPYTIDAVYVLVGFADHSRKELGNGVWPMYFVQPGVHRVTRFSVPVGVAGFETIHLHRITTNSAEAFQGDRIAVELVERETVPPGTVGDTAMGRIIPYDPHTKY